MGLRLRSPEAGETQGLVCKERGPDAKVTQISGRRKNSEGGNVAEVFQVLQGPGGQ